MGYIECSSSGGGGLKLPDVEILHLQNGGSNTIQCNVGDFIIVDLWNDAATKTTVTSGGTVVGRTTYLALIKCTSTPLVLNLGGASYNYAWGLLIKSPKRNFTTITQISSNTLYSNVAKDSIIYAREDGGPIGVFEIHNVVIFTTDTINANSIAPGAGCVIDDTNGFKFKQTKNFLCACYIS